MRRTRSAADLETFVSRLRVHTISDQDDAGPWMRREFPTLHYIGLPSTPDSDQYYLATWTGISGNHFFKNADGADFTTFTNAWVEANVRSKGPLGRLYPLPCCIDEGDTPSFLGLINNGLASFMSPTYGGWGGRYVWRQYYGETRPSWTQGGNSRDTVVGTDRRPRTTDQATTGAGATRSSATSPRAWIGTIRPPDEANHNPTAIVNGRGGLAPITIDTTVGAAVTLDASASTDPDGHTVRFSWFFYPEAGAGIPTQPVAAGPPVQIGGGGSHEDGGVPSAGAEGPPAPPARVTFDNATGPRVTATMRTPGTAHVILAVDDNGAPSLTSYRRIILRSPAR